MKLRLYGLLHIQENETTSVNISATKFQDQIAIYIRMAIHLSESLARSDVEFVLLTNNRSFVQQLLEAEGSDLPVKEIPFPTQIPPGTKFFSAHFKLDVFRYFATLDEPYVGFCDLDVFCINDFPACYQRIVDQQTPLFYDISDQVIPAYGHDVIIRDLESIHHQPSEGRWAGGEFISGAPSFFAALCEKIDVVFGDYLQVIDGLHHVSDESVTTAALELLRQEGMQIADAGTLGLVGRFWSVLTLHPQRPFQYYEGGFLLHLPADKSFLSDKELRGASRQQFLQKYRAYLFKRKFRNIAATVANNTFRRGKTA